MLLSGQITNGTLSTVRGHPDSVFSYPEAVVETRSVGMSLPQTAWVKLNHL